MRGDAENERRLEVIELVEDTQPLVPRHVPHAARSGAAIAIVVLATLLVASEVMRLREAHQSNERAQELATIDGARRDLLLELAELRRTSAVAIDPAVGGLVVSSAGTRSGAIQVFVDLHTPTHMWIVAAVSGVRADDMIFLHAGGCSPELSGLPTEMNRSLADANGDAHLTAGPLSFNPDDPTVWVELRTATTVVTRARGPLIKPRRASVSGGACVR